jgi:hypothetical protein
VWCLLGKPCRLTGARHSYRVLVQPCVVQSTVQGRGLPRLTTHEAWRRCWSQIQNVHAKSALILAIAE